MRCIICGKDLSGQPAMRDNVTGILYCSQHSSYMDAINAGTISSCPACGFRYSQAHSSFPNATCPSCGSPLTVKAAPPEEIEPRPVGGDFDLASRLKWEVKLSDGGDTGSTYGPLLYDDTLFMTTGNCLHAVTIEGELVWTFQAGWDDNTIEPVVEAGLVVAHTLKDKVRAIDAVNGDLRWEVEPPLGKMRSGVAFEGTRVYAVDDSREMACLAAEDGAVLWSFENTSRMPTPVAFDDRVYATSYSGFVIALDAKTGDKLWSAGDKIGWYLAVANDELICTTWSGLAAFDTGTGEQRWVTDLQTGGISPLAVYGDSVYVRTKDHGVCRILQGSGELAWKHQEEDTDDDYVFDRPAVAEGWVVTSLTSGHLHGLDAETGDLRWAHKGYPSVPAVAQGILYHLDNRRLCAYDLAGALA